MSERGFAYKEDEPGMATQVLEIGPGPLPAKRFIEGLGKTNVLFVDERPPKFDFLTDFPESKYYQGDVFALFDKHPELIPRNGFDYVLASNVVVAPAKRSIMASMPQFLTLMSEHIRIGGKLIFEEHYDSATRGMRNILEASFAGYPFRVEILREDRSQFVHPRLHHDTSFSLQATRIE
jgi:hypothetical protein